MSAPMLRLVRLASPARWTLAASVLTGFGAAASGIGLTAAASWLIMRAAQQPPVLYLTVAIVAVRTFGLAKGGLRYVERLTGHDAAFRLLGQVQSQAYERLRTSAPIARGDQRSGDLVARLVTDLDSCADALTRVILPYAVAALVGLTAVGFLSAVLPAAGLALLVALGVAHLGVPAIQAALVRRTDARLAPLRGQLTAQIVELVHGATDLIAYDAMASRLTATAQTDDRLRRVAERSSISVGLTSGLIALAGGACAWVALAVGACAVRDGSLDPVMLGVVVLTPLAVFDAVSFLPIAAAAASRSGSALRRVFTVLDRPSPVREPEQPKALPAGPYHLRLEQVSARWQPDEPDVVRDVDLDLPPGHRVALVGPTGSGKSTVAAVCARFLDPSAGRAVLNGTELRHFHSDQVREVVTFVAEDAHVFDSTIEDNLRIAYPDASPERLWEVLESVRLAEWVRSLPEGLATPVGERGNRLSGGQRRRLILARALLADRPILVLDEPTEHLDPPTAAAITNDLLAATTGRTILLITHQPYGLDQLDAVVRLSA